MRCRLVFPMGIQETNRDRFFYFHGVYYPYNDDY